MLRRTLQIMWPAFLMAGVMEMLVFAVVDPGDLRWFGGPAFDWSLGATYTISFLIFWAVIATAGIISALLADGPDDGRSDPF
jgi:Na+/H+ antiporter NhaD/arsenite permease-like protein